MNIFNLDNPFFRAVSKLVDLVWVNILTLICSLPIITAGASFTAMHYLLLRMADNDQGAITRGFFRVFRENFKKATKVWLGVLLIGLIYLYNMYLLRAGILDGMDVMKKLSLGLITIILVVLIMVSNYLFALMARYENTLKQTLKNACLLSFAFFPRSLCMVVIWFFPVALMMLSDYFLWLWFLYGLAFPGYLIAMIMIRIFRKIDDREDETGDELENV